MTYEYAVMTPPLFRGSAGVRVLNELTDDIRANTTLPRNTRRVLRDVV